jgi:hypothetical protein
MEPLILLGALSFGVMSAVGRQTEHAVCLPAPGMLASLADSRAIRRNNARNRHPSWDPMELGISLRAGGRGSDRQEAVRSLLEERALGGPGASYGPSNSDAGAPEVRFPGPTRRGEFDGGQRRVGRNRGGILSDGQDKAPDLAIYRSDDS